MNLKILNLLFTRTILILNMQIQLPLGRMVAYISIGQEFMLFISGTVQSKHPSVSRENGKTSRLGVETQMSCLSQRMCLDEKIRKWNQEEKAFY